MTCAICQTRKPRRFCPGVRGDICTVCCGTEREVTVNCPLDCEYLRDARQHERLLPLSAKDFPSKDIEVTESFLQKNEEMLVALGQRIVMVALDTPGAVDSDVREALEALVRTYRTLQSGVYYETRPANPLAARIYDAVQEASAEYRKRETESLGMPKTRDSDVLGLLVFFQRLAWDRNNGRPKGRTFIDMVRAFYFNAGAGAGPAAPVSSSLILP
ncbi:MAG TPA: hypothetical protein VG675_14600 [Bryobacteraceae bacterium]|nr:hypothetical protein [Bryobacteraceae bacterium]